MVAAFEACQIKNAEKIQKAKGKKAGGVGSIYGRISLKMQIGPAVINFCSAGKYSLFRCSRKE